MPNLDSIGTDRTTGRELFLFDGADPSTWDVPSGHSLGPFTVLLAIDADQYPDDVVARLAERLLEIVGWPTSAPGGQAAHGSTCCLTSSTSVTVRRIGTAS